MFVQKTVGFLVFATCTAFGASKSTSQTDFAPFPLQGVQLEIPNLETGKEYQINACALIKHTEDVVCFPTKNGGFVLVPIDKFPAAMESSDSSQTSGLAGENWGLIREAPASEFSLDDLTTGHDSKTAPENSVERMCKTSDGIDCDCEAVIKHSDGTTSCG